AAIRGHAGVALGNVVGSNMFNLLVVIGAVGLATPLSVPQQIVRFDLWILLLVTAVVVPYLSGMRNLGRVDGAVMIACYGLYVAVQIIGVGNVLPIVK
ncbi:MAG: hypothetical protein H6907_11280, partial [Hyphomicrobiales bacterium]|nr:hypothetical protein [Hyphomicrobiales bacterium]